MIYPGTDLKFKVSVKTTNKTPDKRSLSLSVVDQYGRRRYEVAGSDFIADRYGGLYFVLPNVPRGVYFAELTCHVHDVDFPDKEQSVVDVQHLANVGVCEMRAPRFHQHDKTEGIEVAYERVLIADVANAVLWVFGDPLPAMLSGSGDGGDAQDMTELESRVAELERRLEQMGGPDSVGTEEIMDGSIRQEDLDEDVQEGLDELNNISLTEEDLEDIFFPKE